MKSSIKIVFSTFVHVCTFLMLSIKAALNALFFFASRGNWKRSLEISNDFLTKSLIAKNRSCDDNRKLMGYECDDDGDEHSTTFL